MLNVRKNINSQEYIQCDTGKNNKPKVLNAAKLVKGAIRLSGSVQSLDSDVLINIKRNNISADDLMQLAVEADAIDADSRSEVILALPGETLQSHFRTLQIVIDAGFNHANTYQLMMLPGTELSSPETRRKYNMKTRYRVLPRCFGYYNILNKQIIAAEIEEICVSTDTLSFDDYLKCRKLHLMIHIFHTDGLFSSTLKFLKFLNISPFKWLEILMKSELDSLTELFTQYEKESRDELWISRNDIENYIHNPGVIERYISGELGYNLLFIHKSIALGKNVTGLKKLAIDTLQKLLILEHKDSLENMIFLNDVVNFDTCKIKNIFEKINDIPNENFSYDVLQFQNDKQPKDIRKYLMIEPSKFFFILDSTRKDVIVRALSLYGDSQIGIGRILTKVFVKKILRQPIPEHSINNIQNK